jgi:hypothetical protein
MVVMHATTASAKGKRRVFLDFLRAPARNELRVPQHHEHQQRDGPDLNTRRRLSRYCVKLLVALITLLVAELLNSPAGALEQAGADFSTFTTMQPVKRTALAMANMVTINILFFIFAELWERFPIWCA